MEEIVGEDGELKPGMQVYSDDEAYNLYNNYALRKGFSIRKGHIRRDASGNVRLREFMCAKEGFARDQDTFEQKRYKKLETRTGCKAMIVFTVADGIWTISHINSEHNHDLARPEERQFLKSGRKVLEAHGNVMLSMLGAGIPPTKSFFYLANEMGGPENVGFTKKDVHNFLQRKKNEMLEAGDGQSLLNHFKRKQDEDKAMAKAIGQVFPGTQHRLCTWHISKNAGKRIGSYLANPEFKKQFNKCLHGCSTETEFQASWDDMISRYNLGGNTWLEKLYSLREKWCPVFSLDIFSAKIRSTQRSESTNNVFHQISTHTMELIKFVHHYEKKIEEMRLAELEDDYRCKNGTPRPQVWSRMLRRAAKVYTIKMFQLFETEFVGCMGVRLKEAFKRDEVHSYEAIEDGKQSVHKIQYNSISFDKNKRCKPRQSRKRD